MIVHLAGSMHSFPAGSVVKASARNAGDLGSIPGSGKIPWRRKWQPTPVFLPGESHGQRSLLGCSPRGRKESDATERLHFHFQRIEWWVGKGPLGFLLLEDGDKC